MSQVIGRAGFHAQHAKNVGDRGAILHEMMREFDEDSIAYWAKRNPNIVVADEVLNEAMVNDGAGGFRVCTDRREVLDYGADRVRRVKRKLREDKRDPKTGKMKGGTVTTSLLVAHLPKSMCTEIPDYYPVLDSKTGEPSVDADGEPMMRSRWVARDRDEARRYFQDLIGYLSDRVIPGGTDAVLGYDIQHSESTPHVQIIADTFAQDPNSEDALRVESSRAWFSHRDVTDENGKQKGGKTKMREYHAGLKKHLIDLGYDISADFDEKRHLVGMGKDEYGRVMDAKHHVDKLQERAVEDHVKLNDWDEALLNRKHDLRERESMLERREAEIPALRRQVVAEAKDEGRQEGFEAGRAMAQKRANQAMKIHLSQIRANTPNLVDDFLDRKDSKGRSYRPIFERYVDQRLKHFEAQHGVTDLLELEAGDRETFIDDGGQQLAADVARLQRDRTPGD